MVTTKRLILFGVGGKNIMVVNMKNLYYDKKEKKLSTKKPVVENPDLKFKGEKGDKGDKGDPGEPGKDGKTPVEGVDYFIKEGLRGFPGKNGSDGKSLDPHHYIPYINAIKDVDLGNHELYTDGIHVDGSTALPPTGPGLTLAYFTGAFPGDTSMIASMNWDAGIPIDLAIEGKDINIDASDINLNASNVNIGNDLIADGGTCELDRIETFYVNCSDGFIKINSADSGGRFLVTGDNRSGYTHQSSTTGNYSQFATGVNVGGALSTITIHDAGTGYNVDDVLEIYQPGIGACGGRVWVNTVDGVGGVTSVSVNTGGTAYIVQDDLETVLIVGGGTGCRLNITGVTVGGYVFLQSNSDGDSVTQPIQIWIDAAKEYEFSSTKLDLCSNGLKSTGLSEHADNAAALLAGLTAGDFYRTADVVKVVH